MYVQKHIHFFHDLILWLCKEETGLLFAQGERRCIIIKLIINLPTDDIGKNMFDEQFSKLQAKLVAESIKKLNVDDTSKQKLCLGVLELLNNKVKEVKENDR